MRVIIAEKPSLARAIAAVLPRGEKKGDYIECSDGTVVAWCAGHILEQANPESYEPAWKEWKLEHLPMVPTQWKLEPKTPGLLKTIRELVKKADCVVNAGDPDREGQLLVDEVLGFVGYRGRVERLHVNDYNPDAIRAALKGIKPNTEFRGLYESALGRQRADWLYGMNLTRLYTLQGRAGGHSGVLSVGRVQTPVLGLVARRDHEIETFVPKPFWALWVQVEGGGSVFKARWVAGEAAKPALDDAGRLVQKAKAQEVVGKVKGQPGRVVKYERTRKKKSPPLPFSLSKLQVAAGKALGLGPQETLDVVQALYETHRLATYPRSDCEHIPEGHFADAGKVLGAVAKMVPGLAAVVGKADPAVQSAAWNDSKITAHHAIIPTATTVGLDALNEKERAVYELIARRYVAQFFPPEEWDQTTVEVAAAGELWRATGKRPVAPGWKVVTADPEADDDEKTGKGQEEEEEEKQTLPELREGQDVRIRDAGADEKRTTPPSRFTEEGLVEAMVAIAKYVQDPRIRSVLKETDGIGTNATRGAIIETLFERGYLAKKGRQVFATPTGKAMVAALPPVATTPDMTALWEMALRQVEGGTRKLDAFLSGVESQLRQLVDVGKAKGALTMPGASKCPKCGAWLRRVKGKKGWFWACTKSEPGGRGCRFTAEDVKGQPALNGEAPSRAGAKGGANKAR